MAHCDHCGKLVLAAVAFDGDTRQRRCAHCDTLLNSSVEWIEGAELEERGYYIGKAPPSGKGCGGGCGSSCGTRRA
jgi:phage FluMu protein Com